MIFEMTSRQEHKVCRVRFECPYLRQHTFGERDKEREREKEMSDLIRVKDIVAKAMNA